MLSPIIAAILMPVSSISVVLFATLSTNFVARRMKLINRGGINISVIVLLIGVSLLVAIGFLIAFLIAVKKGQYKDTHTPCNQGIV